MKNILVAIDTSPRATLVLQAAITLATATGGKIHLYRSVGLPVELPASIYAAPMDLMGTLLAAADQDLAQRMNEVPEPLRGHAIAEVATPWDGICRQSAKLDVDLVLIGSHGYGGFDFLLGTTAARVVNHCDRSVMVVRARPETAPVSAT